MARCPLHPAEGCARGEILVEAYHSILRILLVEDSDADVLIARRALAKSGVAFRLDIARDGREALDLLYGRKTPEPDVDECSLLPHLVLLDMELPRVSGLGVLTQIKVDPRLRTIPVVVLTGSTDEEQRRACMDLGASMYLLKPPATEDVVNMVRVCCGPKEPSPCPGSEEGRALR
ncbi:MAG: response regulator [Gemmatimonadetes bacterium]|nr:response regulator [Gemmatimonadota bacterium]